MPAIVIVIVLPTWIIVLNDGRHNPSWIFAEVYDHPQPTVGLDVLPIEALSTGDRVQGVEIGARYGLHDYVDMVE